MRYQLMIWEDESTMKTPAECAEWVEETGRKAGLQLCARLRGSTDTTTVEVRDGEVVVSDGPFAETKEQIGGYHILECDNLDEAIELAAQHPAAATGTIEVRPFWEI